MKTLNWISPKASDKVKEQIHTNAPALKGTGLSKKARKTVYSTIMETKDNILDFCQDVLEDIQDGTAPFKALKECFRKVGVMILRALKSAVTAGIMLVLGRCSCFCLGSYAIKEAISSVYTKLAKMVKSHLKKLMKMKAPDWIVDKLSWNWKAEDDIGDATPKSAQKRASGEPTARAKADMPEHEEKAIKEGNRTRPKRRKTKTWADDSDVDTDEGEDSESDGEWGDDDDDSDTEKMSDFSNDAGGASDDEPPEGSMGPPPRS
jgi:hypothetical protein